MLRVKYTTLSITYNLLWFKNERWLAHAIDIRQINIGN